MLFQKVCNDPHPNNSDPRATEMFCDRPENHAGSHSTTVDGTKYFW